jgi:hypothetical protein
MLLFLWWEIAIPTLRPQTGGPFIVGCPRMLLDYIRRYYFLHQGASRKGNKEPQVKDRLTFLLTVRPCSKTSPSYLNLRALFAAKLTLVPTVPQEVLNFTTIATKMPPSTTSYGRSLPATLTLSVQLSWMRSPSCLSPSLNPVKNLSPSLKAFNCMDKFQVQW